MKAAKLFGILGAAMMITSMVTMVPAEEDLSGRDEMSTGSLEFRVIGEDGNNELYHIENVESLGENSLTGKTLYWLGSSVAYGEKADGFSMADYIAKRDGANCVKETVSGTTFAENGVKPETCYVDRMLDGAFDPEEKVDAFICQISTNDAIVKNQEFKGEMPSVIPAESLESVDYTTTLGAVQYIIEYVEKTWDCPVYFFSGAYFGDENDGIRGNKNPGGSDYAKYVADVTEIAKAYDALDGYTVKVIDLFNDAEFNAQVSDEDYVYLMHDRIHPRRAGYLVWWTPYFEEFLLGEFGA